MAPPYRNLAKSHPTMIARSYLGRRHSRVFGYRASARTLQIPSSMSTNQPATKPTAASVFSVARERAKSSRQPGVWTDGRIVVVADRREGSWKYDVGTHAVKRGYGDARAMAPVLEALIAE